MLLASCQQLPEDDPDDLRGLLIGECLGNVNFVGDRAEFTEDTQIVDCSSSEAQLQLEAKEKVGTQCQVGDYSMVIDLEGENEFEDEYEDDDLTKTFCFTTV